MFKNIPKSFLIWFLITFVFIILTVMAINILVDPFGIFNLTSIENINKYKPLVAYNLRMTKAHAVHKYKPTAIILGSSRAEVSINPDHPGFSASGYKTYNMAMAGSGIYEILQYLKHSYYASGKQLKAAIIGLDFLMFNANREKIVFDTEVRDYNEHRLMLNERDLYLKSLLFDIDRLLIFNGFRSSIQTIKTQNSNELYLDNGMRHPSRNTMVNTLPLKGHREVFINNEKYYMEKIWTAGAEQRYCQFDLNDNSSTYDALREIVEFSRTKNIDLKLFTSPTHARLLISIKEAGLWQELNEFKRNIVNILEEDAKKHPEQKSFELWDFMTFNSISMEPVPEIDNKQTEMRWYWEMSHYKISTGNLVLNHLLNFNNNNEVMPNDFGTILTVSNIDNRLNQLLADSKQYEKNNPKYYEEIHNLAEGIFKDRSGSCCSKAYRIYLQAQVLRERGDKQEYIKQLDIAFKLHKQDELYATLHDLPYREKIFFNDVMLY